MQESGSRSCDVIIIGGGPAGLFTASRITGKQSVLILEKNESAGKKLLLAGSGRCNITHTGPLSDFFKHYGANHRFLKTALNTFSNQNLLAFLKERSIETIVDKNGKIFPASEKSKDILMLLLNECAKNGVAIQTHEAVVEVEKRANLFLVKTKKSEYSSAQLVIATGGKSYPATGSAGDGYLFAQNLGHTIISPKPALAPVFICPYSFADLSGVSLSGREITLFRDNKKIGQQRGDFGFTPTGLSGPGILDFSRYLAAGDMLKINLVDKASEEFKNYFIETAGKEGDCSLKRFLKKFDIPESLIKIILSEINLDGSEKLAQIAKQTRTGIATFFCSYPFMVQKLGDFNTAMATKGGISLTEVSSGTMESKLVSSLFFTGEVLDIDGDTGGYNLQAAFSTGYLAAKAISRKTD